MIFGPRPSPVHSARVGAEVEVHYRWHALYGRRLRLHYSEVRDGTRLSFVEAGPGVVIVMPSWMLDPAACAATTFGAPQIDCNRYGCPTSLCGVRLSETRISICSCEGR